MIGNKARVGRALRSAVGMAALVLVMGGRGLYDDTEAIDDAIILSLT